MDCGDLNSLTYVLGIITCSLRCWVGPVSSFQKKGDVIVFVSKFTFTPLFIINSLGSYILLKKEIVYFPSAKNCWQFLKISGCWIVHWKELLFLNAGSCHNSSYLPKIGNLLNSSNLIVGLKNFHVTTAFKEYTSSFGICGDCFTLGKAMPVHTAFLPLCRQRLSVHWPLA